MKNDAFPEYALAGAEQHLKAIQARTAGRRLAVVMRYEGVLTPPEGGGRWALLSHEEQRTLRELARQRAVIILSARDQSVLRGLVGVPEVSCAGSLGLDLWTPKRGLVTHPRGLSALPLLDGAEAALAERIAVVPRAWVERRRFALVVHADWEYRPLADTIVTRVLSAYPELHTCAGNDALTIAPNLDWHIGKAVRWVLTEVGMAGPEVLPLYIGGWDDEEAFEAVATQGFGIVVGGASGLATETFGFVAPHEVTNFLTMLASSEGWS